MLDRVTLQAQAKLNLTLEITGRRADGYHLLRSVMQSVSICDLLEIERSPEGWELRCDDPALSCGEDNTVTRSMRAFVETARPKGGVRIVLRKRLPYQAGLGSASADAAATLLGLNLLFGEPLAADALAALGLRIGADVPFGLQGGTMLAQGIGEQLTPLPPLTGGVFVIAKPAEGMSTPEAYARYDALKSPMQPDSARLCAALAAGEPKRIAAGFGNVLEQIGPPAGVARLKSALLREGALGAAMTGSGTAVFGLFCDEASARAACATLVPQTVFCETARPLSRGVYRLTGEASAF